MFLFPLSVSTSFSFTLIFATVLSFYIWQARVYDLVI